MLERCVVLFVFFTCSLGNPRFKISNLTEKGQWERLQANLLEPIYGVQGEFSNDNHPGQRIYSFMHSDKNSRYFYLGYGQQSVSGFFNDMWVYDTEIGQWAWINGLNSITTVDEGNAPFNYEFPAARGSCNTWLHSNGDIWLYGGHLGFPNGFVNFYADLWKFDTVSYNWTYFGGSNVSNPGQNIHAQYSGDNPHPGDKARGVTWIDGNNLYLFGGSGHAGPGVDGLTSDLWMYKITASQWVYLGGPMITDGDFNYGTLGNSSSQNWPPARQFSVKWQISPTVVYMFGGQRDDNLFLSDLWKWENSKWTWVGGNKYNTNVTSITIYGNELEFSSKNVVGDRSLALPWLRNKTELIMYGGLGISSEKTTAALNDIWIFDIKLKLWKWSGSNLRESVEIPNPPTYGSANTVLNSSLIIFGGVDIGNQYNGDMWRFDILHFDEKIIHVPKNETMETPISDGAITAIVVICIVLVGTVGAVGLVVVFNGRKIFRKKQEKKVVAVPLETVAVTNIPAPPTLPVIPESEMMEGITIGAILGIGNFGEVYKGNWSNTPVALKKIKKEYFVQFQKEVNALMNIKHPKIVQYLGVFIEKEYYIVMELMTAGDLKSLVSSKDFSDKDLLSMALDGASGVAYLHGNNIIHRDIALRNFLASYTSNGTIIGLSAFLSESYYISESKTLPYKWASTEVLKFSRYSTASDVWAFGIVLWEIYSLGCDPYLGKSTYETSEFVLAGNRLTKPDRCPPQIFDLMTKCWSERTKERPDMKTVYEQLREFWDDEYGSKSTTFLNESQHVYEITKSSEIKTEYQ